MEIYFRGVDIVNVLMIQDYLKKYDKVEVVRHDHKSQYVICTKKYESGEKEIQKIIDAVGFGNITFNKEGIEVKVKIKN